MTDLKCFRLLALVDNHFFLLSPLSGFPPISHYSVSTIFHYFLLQRNQINWICKIIKFIMPKENRKRRGDFPLLMIMLVVANKCPQQAWIMAAVSTVSLITTAPDELVVKCFCNWICIFLFHISYAFVCVCVFYGWDIYLQVIVWIVKLITKYTEYTEIDYSQTSSRKNCRN